MDSQHSCCRQNIMQMHHTRSCWLPNIANHAGLFSHNRCKCLSGNRSINKGINKMKKCLEFKLDTLSLILLLHQIITYVQVFRLLSDIASSNLIMLSVLHTFQLWLLGTTLQTTTTLRRTIWLSHRLWWTTASVSLLIVSGTSRTELQVVSQTGKMTALHLVFITGLHSVSVPTCKTLFR